MDHLLLRRGAELTGDPAQAEQYVRVCKFRKSLEKQGIVAHYTGVRGTADSFYEKVATHLRQIVRAVAQKTAPASRGPGDSPPQPGPPAKPPSVAKPIIPPDYLDWLRDTCADVDLLGLRVQQGQAVTLKNVYVPLTTQAEREPEGKRGRREPVTAGEEDQPVQTLLGLLETDSLYVAGPPGSGKSTFCRWVAWLACEGRLPAAQIAAPDKYQETFPAVVPGASAAVGPAARFLGPPAGDARLPRTDPGRAGRGRRALGRRQTAGRPFLERGRAASGRRFAAVDPGRHG